MVPLIYNYFNGNYFADATPGMATTINKTSLGGFSFSSLASSLENKKLSQLYKLINVISDLVACTVFFIFYFYWSKKTKMIR